MRKALYIKGGFFSLHRNPYTVNRALYASYFVSIAVMILTIMAAPSFAEKPPLWWPQALDEARGAGYSLITPEGLKAVQKAGEVFLLLDVRPDYEYRSGHIPGALNFEFHLGDRLRMERGKEEAFRRMLGPDRGRKVVIYCRNFR